MHSLARIFAAALTCAVALVSPVLADEAKPFADAKEINLVDLLPPPPANGSAQTKAELGEILTIQVTSFLARRSVLQGSGVSESGRGPLLFGI